MRVRDIIHASGRRLRVGLDRGCAEDAMTIQLSDPQRPGAEPILLDLYGGELLAGFLMLAASGDLAEENCSGPLGCRLRLTGRGDRAAVELCQRGEALAVPQIFWDRLYAELTLALIHGRHLEMTGTLAPFPSTGQQRVLH